MDIGLGLPIANPAVLLDWARRADAGPFRTLGLLDRIVYDNPEPLVTLAVLAGATQRVRLQTEVLIAPTRDTAILAKQAATLDRLSGGRLTLGLGVGGRDDDYHAVGVNPRHRGRLLDTQLATLRRLWSGAPLNSVPAFASGHAVVSGAVEASDATVASGNVDLVDVDLVDAEPSGIASTAEPRYVGPIGPRPIGDRGPEMLFGAFRPAALARVTTWGDGFLCAAPFAYAGHLVRTVEHQWTEAGRPGRPRIVAQVNAALGDEATVAAARSELRRYYGDQPWAANLLHTSADLTTAFAAYEDLGVDELMLYCWASDPTQVDRLASVF